MATVRKITRDDHSVMPWKNGGGTTREIATGGVDADNQDWGWRVSIASVERDGAYSEFPGVDRLTTVVVGNGTDLFHPDGSTIALNPLQPVLIPSDVALWGILRDEPILNLNVMTRQGQFTATAEICDGPREEMITMQDGQVLLVHALEGQCAAGSGDGANLNLSAADSMISNGDGRFAITLHNKTRVVVIRISPVSP